jgi:hypothetical protein
VLPYMHHMHRDCGIDDGNQDQVQYRDHQLDRYRSHSAVIGRVGSLRVYFNFLHFRLHKWGEIFSLESFGHVRDN